MRSVLALVVAAVLVLAAPLAITTFAGAPDLYADTTVQASHGGTHIDDFEDGDTSVLDAAWTGWQGDTGGLSTSTSDPLEGSTSGKFTSSNQDININATTGSAVSPSRFSMRVRLSTDLENTGDLVAIQLVNSGTEAMNIRLQHSTEDIEYFDGSAWQDTGADWRPGGDLTIEFRDINWASDTYDIWINGRQYSDDVTFDKSTSAFDTVKIISQTDASAGTADLYFDDVQYGGSNLDYTQNADTRVEDFEDSDITIEADGFTGWHDNTSALSTTTTSPINESVSGLLTSDNANTVAAISSTSGAYTENVTANININSDTGGNADTTDEFAIRLADGDTHMFTLRFLDGSKDITYGGGANGTDTGSDWQVGTDYTVEFVDINTSADTLDVVLNGNKILDDGAFDNTASGYTEIRFISDSRVASTSRDVRIDNIDVGVVTVMAASSSSDPNAGTYLHTVELQSETDTIRPQTAEMQAYFADLGGIADGEDDRATTFDEVTQALDGDGYWVLEDTDEFDFENTSTVRLHNGVIYDLRVYDSANGGFYAEVHEADKSLWKDRTMVFHVDEPQSIISCENYAGAGSCDPANPEDSGGPYLDTDGTTFTWYDPSGSTTSIDYNITFPDGTTYEFNESFDDPISSYTGNLSGFDQEPVEISWAADSNGSTYGGTLDWGQGGSGLSESGGLGVPLGGGGGGGGGGIAGAPWWVWLALLGGAGYFARDELSQAAQNASPAVRRAASRTAGAVTKAAASGARGAARAARRIIQR